MDITNTALIDPREDSRTAMEAVELCSRAALSPEARARDYALDVLEARALMSDDERAELDFAAEVYA